MAFTNPLHGLLFSPCIEPDVAGAVVTEKSYALLESGRFNQVPSIIGHNSLEAMVASYCNKLFVVNIISLLTKKMSFF